MVDETSKTRLVRSEDFDKEYLQGKVLDIGAGEDRVCAHAEGFDTEDGDANRILDFQERESYDTVYSSHCLEHMFDPPQALQQWWELIKPGGYLVLVVPDENLYEQEFGQAYSVQIIRRLFAWTPPLHGHQSHMMWDRWSPLYQRLPLFP